MAPSLPVTPASLPVTPASLPLPLASAPLLVASVALLLASEPSRFASLPLPAASEPLPVASLSAWPSLLVASEPLLPASLVWPASTGGVASTLLEVSFLASTVELAELSPSALSCAASPASTDPSAVSELSPLGDAESFEAPSAAASPV